MSSTGDAVSVDPRRDRDEAERLVRSEDGVSAYWGDCWRLRLDPVELRGILWCRQGLVEAHRRTAGSGREAFRQWSAAVEAVWWAVALDDALYAVHGGRYIRARTAHQDGETVVGLRWLRHQHAHRMVVTGEGGPKSDFLGDGGGPPFFISPSNRWLIRSAIPPHGRKQDLTAELAYDTYVGGNTLEGPTGVALRWFDSILTASQIDPWQEVDGDDPTVL